MTKYEYLHRISEIIVPEQTEEFFNYLLHSSDENGDFLRTRYCYWEKPLPDSICDHKVKCALVTLQVKYDFDNFLVFYDDSGYTNIKLQVHFGEYENDDDFYMKTEWASAVGFPYWIRIDMENGTYEISEFRYEKNRHYTVGKPKYHLGESVRFRVINSGDTKNKDGIIRIVDAFGTVEQQEEPSYDIEIIENEEVCLCKHIRESNIIFRHRPKVLKDYI